MEAPASGRQPHRSASRLTCTHRHHRTRRARAHASIRRSSSYAYGTRAAMLLRCPVESGVNHRTSADDLLRPRRRDCVMAWSALQISNRLALPEQESRRRSPSVPRGAPQGRHLIKVEAGASSLQSNTIPKPSQMRQTISNRYMSADSCKAMTKLPSEQYHQMEYYGLAVC